MKKAFILITCLCLASPVLLAGDASRCRKLLLSASDADGTNEEYRRDTEAAYRDCRGPQLPLDIRIEAHLRYADVRAQEGETQTAIDIFDRAISLLDASMGECTSMLIDALDRVARLESRARLREEALEHATRALLLRKEKFGNESSEAAMGLSRLGMAYVDHRDFRAAEPLIRSAISVAEKACGPSCDALSEAFSAMSVWFSDQGNETEAARYSELSMNALPVPPRRRTGSNAE